MQGKLLATLQYQYLLCKEESDASRNLREGTLPTNVEATRHHQHNA
jgi:hypothetical protein